MINIKLKEYMPKKKKVVIYSDEALATYDKQRKAKGTLKSYLLIREITRMVAIGIPRDEITDELCDKYGFTDRDGIARYHKAAIAALDERNRKYFEDIAKANTQRLTAIIEEAHEVGDRKSMLTAIDMLNKMGNIYTQKIEVDSKNPVFEIKIGD